MAKFSLTTLQAGKTMDYTNAFTGNGVFLVAINGTVQVGNITLGKRDAVGISGVNNFTITATEDAELLAIEIPMA
jgi:quercetin 2,3-dioxygenase